MTLVALVITLVVIIIISTVSIEAVLGEDGIIKKADDTFEKQENKIIEGEEKKNKLFEEYANVIETPALTPLDIAKKDAMLTKKENTKLEIGYETVWIPAGFKVHEESADVVDEGIVITDGTNEFVWVPVDNVSFNEMFNTAEPAVALSGSTGVKTEHYSNLRVRSDDSYNIATVVNGAYSSTSAIREPDLVTDYDEDATNKYYEQAGYESAEKMAQGFVDDYEAMRASIQKYKGFYIGRYELTGTLEAPTVKSGNVLTEHSNHAESWYGLYKACRNVKGNNEYVTSTMIWGCQWDETIKWLKNTQFKNNLDAVDIDSSGWGNYVDANVTANDGETAIKASGTGKKLETGITTYTMANKIYDLAGNYYDWTQEGLYNGYRVFRGR